MAHRIPDGFELFELKLKYKSPYEAAVQMMRYAATYMLYVSEPELAWIYKGNELLLAERVDLIVLAPAEYYQERKRELQVLQGELSEGLTTFVQDRSLAKRLAFRFMSLPEDFHFRHDDECGKVREAIEKRSPI